MKEYTKWEDFPRLDLKHIPTFRALGFVPVFNDRDIAAGRCTPQKVPNHNVRFSRNDIMVEVHATIYQDRIVSYWRVWKGNNLELKIDTGRPDALEQVKTKLKEL